KVGPSAFIASKRCMTTMGTARATRFRCAGGRGFLPTYASNQFVPPGDVDSDLVVLQVNGPTSDSTPTLALETHPPEQLLASSYQAVKLYAPPPPSCVVHEDENPPIELSLVGPFQLASVDGNRLTASYFMKSADLGTPLFDERGRVVGLA